jgi:hypothetical protein
VAVAPQDPHDATSQKTAFFIVTAVKTSNWAEYVYCGKYGRYNTLMSLMLSSGISHVVNLRLERTRTFIVDKNMRW